MDLDRLSPGELEKFHDYRKRFAYLYLCKGCMRSFDAEKRTSICKFCGSQVKELERDDRLSAKPLYTYVCALCYKEFIAENADQCVKCGGRFLHKYRTVKIGTRQLLSMRKNQIKNGIKGVISNVKNMTAEKSK